MRAFAIVRLVFFGEHSNSINSAVLKLTLCLEGFLTLFSVIVFSVGAHICSHPMANLSQEGLPIAPDQGQDSSLWDMITPDARNLPVATSVITLIVVVPQLVEQSPHSSTADYMIMNSLFFSCLIRIDSWTRFIRLVCFFGVLAF